MFYLGLLLPICYVVGLTGASVPAQWPFLSAALTPVLWRRAAMTPLHWLGLFFIAYAAINMFHTRVIWDGLYGLWIIAIWALSFWLGSSLTSLRPIWKGLAVGLTISTAVAIIQWFGYNPVYVNTGNPAGLLINQTVQSAAIALVILGLINERLWFYIPALLPGLYLAGSRGGWVVLGLGLAAKIRWYIALLPLAALGAYYLLFHHGPTDINRLEIWRAAWLNLTPFGLGTGSFNEIYIQRPTFLLHPEFVHNDYLQLLFEYGIGAIPIFAILAIALAQTSAPTQPILLAWAVLAIFYFPLYCPITAFLGALLAGHLSRGLTLNLAPLHHWRSSLLLWLFPTRSPAISTQHRVAQQ